MLLLVNSAAVQNLGSKFLVFNKLKFNLAQSSFGARSVGIGGLAETVFNLSPLGPKPEGFFGKTLSLFDFGLNALGIASMFCAPHIGAAIAFYVACGYTIKALGHVAAAGYAFGAERNLTKGLGHLASAVITLATAWPALKYKSIANKVRTIGPIQEPELKYFGLDPIKAGFTEADKTAGIAVFGRKKLDVLEANVRRLERAVEAEQKGFVEVFETQERKLAKEIADDATKVVGKKEGKKIVPHHAKPKSTQIRLEQDLTNDKWIQGFKKDLEANCRTHQRAVEKAEKALKEAEEELTRVEAAQKQIKRAKLKNKGGVHTKAKNAVRDVKADLSKAEAKFRESDKQLKALDKKLDAWKEADTNLTEAKKRIDPLADEARERGEKSLIDAKVQAERALQKAKELDKGFRSLCLKTIQEREAAVVGDYEASLVKITWKPDDVIDKTMLEAYGTEFGPQYATKVKGWRKHWVGFGREARTSPGEAFVQKVAEPPRNWFWQSWGWFKKGKQPAGMDMKALAEHSTALSSVPTPIGTA